MLQEFVEPQKMTGKVAPTPLVPHTVTRVLHKDKLT